VVDSEIISNKMFFSGFFRSLKYALNGIVILLTQHRNFKIQAAIACMVVVAGFTFRINLSEWLGISLCISLVLSLEAINSAIEILADTVQPERNKVIGTLKDIAAGGVLIASIMALVVGFLIFAPKIIDLF
jgi:diacylglycerol kinase